MTLEQIEDEIWDTLTDYDYNTSSVAMAKSILDRLLTLNVLVYNKTPIECSELDLLRDS